MDVINCKRVVFQGAVYNLFRFPLSLTNTFLAEGCLRHKEMNHITALIDDRRLSEALHKANINRGILSLTKTNNEEHPMLKFPVDYTLCVIRGRHRIFAGPEILMGNERWWTVRLYIQSKRSECTPNTFVLSLHRHPININYFVFLTSN